MIRLGVRLGQQTKAYPFELLNQRPLLHDEINGVPILVWFDPATQTGQAFMREIEGEVLTFTAVPNQPGRLQDEQTGSQWQGLTGRGVDGRYANQQLPILISTPAFEFGWYGYFPDSETYGKE